MSIPATTQRETAAFVLSILLSATLNERKVLFSVWSPFQTDDPKNIPDNQKVKLLGKGPNVVVKEFGNEGSGGQSWLTYPWIAGKTYRFLTEVSPDDSGNTIYTSWFSDADSDEWNLMASFIRPSTSTYLKGFHSFLENFYPETGNFSRSVNFKSVWIRTIDEKWIEIKNAMFTVDDTGRKKSRLDFSGGVDGSDFFLKNCGFFNDSTKPDIILTKKSQNIFPRIKFNDLPR